MAAKRKVPSLWQRVVDWGLRVIDSDDDTAAPLPPRHKLPVRANATIARVRQVYDTSCGVAATAMLARQRHDVVMAFMFPAKKRHYGTYYEDVWRALAHFGVEHERRTRKFVSWEKVPAHALVQIKWKGTPEKSAYHWVIYQKRSKGFHVIDPASTGATLRDIHLADCVGIGYSLVTPRTREEGPLKVAPSPPPTPAAAPKPRRKKSRSARPAAQRS